MTGLLQIGQRRDKRIIDGSVLRRPQLIERGPQLAQVIDVDRDQIQAGPTCLGQYSRGQRIVRGADERFDFGVGRRSGNRVPADTQASFLQQHLGAVPGRGNFVLVGAAHPHHSQRVGTQHSGIDQQRVDPVEPAQALRIQGQDGVVIGQPWPSAAANDSRAVRVAFGVVTNAAVEVMSRLRVVAPTAATPIT